MNKQYIIDSVPVWLEHEVEPKARTGNLHMYRVLLTNSLANHLCNNWNQTHPPLIEWGCRGCGQIQYYALYLGVEYYAPTCEFCGQSSG